MSTDAQRGHFRRVFTYPCDPQAQTPPWGVHRYPSRIGWWVRLPGRRILAIQVRSPR